MGGVGVAGTTLEVVAFETAVGLPRHLPTALSTDQGREPDSWLLSMRVVQQTVAWQSVSLLGKAVLTQVEIGTLQTDVAIFPDSGFADITVNCEYGFLFLLPHYEFAFIFTE